MGWGVFVGGTLGLAGVKLDPMPTAAAINWRSARERRRWSQVYQSFFWRTASKRTNFAASAGWVSEAAGISVRTTLPRAVTNSPPLGPMLGGAVNCISTAVFTGITVPAPKRMPERLMFFIFPTFQPNSPAARKWTGIVAGRRGARSRFDVFFFLPKSPHIILPKLPRTPRPWPGSIPQLMELQSATGKVSASAMDRLRPEHSHSGGFSGRRSGNRITSRMERELVRSMVRRSMPMPSPPAGGMP